MKERTSLGLRCFGTPRRIGGPRTSPLLWTHAISETHTVMGVTTCLLLAIAVISSLITQPIQGQHVAEPIGPGYGCASDSSASQGVCEPSTAAVGASALAGSRWVNLTASIGTAPSPREGAAMGYDPDGKFVLLYGGGVPNPNSSAPGYLLPLNDTWIFQNGSWKNITSTSGPGPAPLVGAALTYDSADGYMLLLGGQTVSGQSENNTWAFSQGHWSLIPPEWGYGLYYINSYPGLVAALDSSIGHVIMLQMTNSNPDQGVTWEYDAGNWTDISFNATLNQSLPSPEYNYPVLVDDPPDKGLLLFGGAPSNLGYGQPLPSVTWTFSNRTWTNLTDSFSPGPPGAIQSAAAFDPTAGTVLVFGGATCSSVPCFSSGFTTYGGFWAYSNGSWTNLTTSSGPRGEVRSSFVWDAAEGIALLFGGGYGGNPGGGGTCTNETWEWSAIPIMSGLRPIVSPDPLDVGVNASFVASFVGGTPPFTYYWEFGDGGGSSFATPTHQYSSAGTYSVNLTVSDSVGRALNSSTIVDVYAVEMSPAASPNPTDLGLSTTFTTGVLGGAGSPNVTWSFGDGTYAHSHSGSTVYRYMSPGLFDVKIWLNDSGGATLYRSFPVQVNAALASPQITATPSTPSLGQLVSFSAKETGGTPPYTYAWTFGDGGTGGNLSDISHIFTTNGPFTARVTVTDWAGASETSLLNLTIALNLTMLAQWSVGASPLLDTFTSAVRGGSSNYTYAWTFGDGATSSVANPTHTFDTPGDYVTQLVVRDSSGHSAQASSYVYVAPGGGPLVVSLIAAPSSVSIGGSTVVRALVYGGEGGYTLTWSNSGQGNCAAMTTLSERCSASTSGSIAVSLAVSDSTGLPASDTIRVFFGTAGPTSTTPGTPSLWGLLAATGIGVMVAAAGTVILLGTWMWQRRRLSPSPLANPRYHLRSVQAGESSTLSNDSVHQRVEFEIPTNQGDSLQDLV